MKTKMKQLLTSGFGVKLLAFFGLGLGLTIATTAQAATPTAAWKGNFTSDASTSVNGVYLIRNSNELVDNGAAIKIGSSKGLYLGNDASGSDWSVGNCTVVIAAKNPSGNATLLELGKSGANNRFSLLINSAKVKTGYKGSARTVVNLDYATTGVPEYFGYSYQNVQNNGSIIGFNGTTGMDGGLMESGTQIGHVTIGGLRDSSLSTGAEISAIFLFKGTRLDATELAKWTTPAVTTLQADKHVEISADTTVSSDVTPLTIEIKSAAKLTYSSAVTLTTLGGFFANKTTTFDCTGLAAGTVLVSGPIYGKDNIDIEGSTLPSGTTLMVTDSAITLVETTVYKAEISESKSWNAISWAPSTPPSGAICELTVSAAGCRVNFDTDGINVSDLTLKGNHTVDLVYTKSATTISSIELDGTTTYRKVYPSGGDKVKSTAWTIPTDVTYVIEGPESGTADTWASITVQSGATLLTRGQLAFSVGKLNGGGTLEVATGKLTNTCGSQQIAGHLVIDAGATYEQTSGSDTLAYESNVPVVDVYGTLSLPLHRWTLGKDSNRQTINVYPGGEITGEGQTHQGTLLGALDANKSTTINVKKKGGVGGTATISATLRPRTDAPAFVFNVEDGMTLVLSGKDSDYHKGVDKTGDGILKVTGTYNLTGTVNVNGGTLMLTGTQLTSGEIALAADGTLECNADTDVTLANTLSGSGDLLKSGTGTWTLTGTLSYAGTTTVSAGTLTVAENKLASDVTVAQNGTLNITSSETKDEYIVTASGKSVTNNGTVQLNGTPIATAGYEISGNKLVKIVPTATVTQNCTWSELWSSLPSPGASVKLIRSGDAADATVTMDSNVTLGTVTVTSESGKNLTLALGSGSLTVSAYDFSGAAGAVTVPDTGSATVTLGEGVVITQTGSALTKTADNAITVSGSTLTVSEGSPTFYNSTLTSLTASGKSVTMTGNNTITDYALGVSSFTVASGSTAFPAKKESDGNFLPAFTINESATATFPSLPYSWNFNQLTVNGTLNVTGMLGFQTGDKTFSVNGTGTINCGELKYGNISKVTISCARVNIGSTGLTKGANNGCTLTFKDGLVIGATADWSMVAEASATLSGALTFDTAGHTVTINGTLTGSSGSLTKTGEGALSLAGASAASYSGATTISAGTLTVAENKLQGDVSVAQNGTLNITGAEGRCAYVITAGEFASSGTVQLNGTEIGTAGYAISGNAICLPASATRENPVTGTSQTFTYEYVGEDGAWATLANWWTLADGYLKPYTQSSVPMIPSSEVWNPTLVDGALFNNKTVSVATIEGYNAMLAVMGGAQVTADTLRKSGGTASEYWVGPNSKLTFTAFGDQSFGADFNFYVASEAGLTFSAELDSTHEKGSRTYNYYLTGDGTVNYAAGVTAGTHKIKQLEVQVGPMKSSKQILKQKLITLGGSSTSGLFSAASDITETCDNTSIDPVYSETRPTTSNDVGTYSIEQESDGVYAYVVAFFEAPTGDIHATVDHEISWSNIIWYNDQEQSIGKVTDFSQINSATLTIAGTGTVTVDNWASIAGVSTKLTIGGAGSVVVTTATDDPTWNWASTGTAWTGTYVVNGADEAASSSAVWNLYKWYNGTSSKVQLNCSKSGYFYNASKEYGELAIASGKTVTINDAYSTDTHKFAKLSGEGTFTCDNNVCDKNAYQQIWIGDVNSFAGTLKLVKNTTTAKNTNGFRLMLGTTEGACDQHKIVIGGNVTLMSTTQLIADADGSVQVSAVLTMGSSSSLSPSVTGAGTIVYDNTIVSTFPTALTGLTAANWTGTVWFKGYTKTQFNFSSFANANSKIKLTGFKGYAPDPTSASTVNDFEFILEDDGDTKALTINDGYSNKSYGFYLGKLTGSGTFTNSKGVSQCYCIKDGASFAGTIATTGPLVVFGETVVAKPNDDLGYIYVQNGKTATIATNKTWSATHGLFVNEGGTIAGSGTFSSAMTFESNAIIDTRNGVLTAGSTITFDTHIKIRVTDEPTLGKPIKVINKAESGTEQVHADVTVYVGESTEPYEGFDYTLAYNGDGLYVTPIDGRTHLYWNRTDSVWTNAEGTVVSTIDENCVLNAQDGDTITFGAATTPHSFVMPETGTVTLGAGGNLLAVPIEVPAAAKLVLGWDAIDAGYTQNITGSGAVDVTGNVFLNVDNQSKTWPLTVKNNGKLKMGGANVLPSNTATAETGGIIDINGKDNVLITINLAGGTLQNTGADTSGSHTQYNTINVTANSYIAGNHSFGMISSNYKKSTIALGENTLTQHGSNAFWLYGTEVTGTGTLKLESGAIHAIKGGGSSAVQPKFENGTFHLAGGELIVKQDNSTNFKLAKLYRTGGKLTIQSSATLSGLAELSGTMDFTSSSAFSCAGTLAFADAVTIASGTTTLNDTAATALAGKTVTVANGATLDIGQKRGLTINGEGGVWVTLTDDEMKIGGVAKEMFTGTATVTKVMYGGQDITSKCDISGGSVTIKTSECEATVGSTYYVALATAIGEATEGSTITLLKDAALAAATTLNNSATLVTGEFAISGEGSINVASGKTISIANGVIGVDLGGEGSFNLTGGFYKNTVTLTGDYRFVELSAVYKNCNHEVVAGSTPSAEDEKVYAAGDEGTIIVSKNDLVTKKYITQEQDVQTFLNGTGANSITNWQNVVLNLSATDATSIPVVAPQQSAPNGKIDFKLGGVTVDTASGATVTYKVQAADSPSAETWTDKTQYLPYTSTATIDLESEGVKYYRFDVLVTPAK